VFIIDSILDTDIYKFFMQQAIFHQFSNSQASYSFKLRNTEDVCLGAFSSDFICQLRAEINHMKTIQLSLEEYKYLNQFDFFKGDYLQYLKHYRFDPYQVTIKVVESENNNIPPRIDIVGPWQEVMLWEIPILAIFNELYFNMVDRKNYLIGYEKLNKKVQHLRLREASNPIVIADFGTRRRFSREWQSLVLRNMKHILSGTSNVQFAMQLGMKPIGTMAHEWIMAGQALYSPMESQKIMLANWQKEYGDMLSVALTDTLGIDKFEVDADFSQWKGVRQDSGDPEEWGWRMIRAFNKAGVVKPILVFSDGLNFQQAFDLNKIFSSVANVSFGIGTNLTNDVGVTPLNIVVKLQELDGKPVAKISDSVSKAMCKDSEYLIDLTKQLMVGAPKHL
jgi:nicotinate phosphoribosyltransferase